MITGLGGGVGGGEGPAELVEGYVGPGQRRRRAGAPQCGLRGDLVRRPAQHPVPAQVVDRTPGALDGLGYAGELRHVPERVAALAAAAPAAPVDRSAAAGSPDGVLTGPTIGRAASGDRTGLPSAP